MKKATTIIALSALLLGGCAATPPANGRDAREWLNLQKAGTAASSERQPMSGEAADKAYQRYVDSFGHPLPERFGREGFTEGQGEGGGGGQQ